jgi:hypothetical protein
MKKSCTIDGCKAKPVSGGLCAKHYTRQRRHGSTDTVKKRGPRPDEFKAKIKTLMMNGSEWSQRTFERYWQAYKMLAESGASEDERRQLRAARPDGSVNVSKLVRGAEMLYRVKKMKKSRRRSRK